jgi:hypothetical protein
MLVQLPPKTYVSQICSGKYVLPYKVHEVEVGRRKYKVRSRCKCSFIGTTKVEWGGE